MRASSLFPRACRSDALLALAVAWTGACQPRPSGAEGDSASEVRGAPDATPPATVWAPWGGFDAYRFSAALPAEPIESREWADTPEGRAEVVTWTVAKGTQAYILALCEYAAGPPADPARVLEAAAAGFVATWQGEVRARREVPVEGGRGLEISLLAEGPIAATARIMLVGRDVFQLVAAARADALPDEGRTFFESFRALPRLAEGADLAAVPVPRPAWTRQVSAGGRFAVLAPRAPTTTTVATETAFGVVDVTLEAFGAEGGESFVVTYTDYPRDAVRQGAERLLEDGLEQLPNALGGRVLSRQKVTLGVLVGEEAVWSLPGDAGPVGVLARAFLEGGRLYLVQALGPGGTPGENGRRFVASFELAPAAGPR